jgi:hydroxypyruvate isomerase
MSLSRRSVLAGGAVVAAAATMTMSGVAPAQNAARFSLGYAPHEGSFRSRGGRLEQIAYAADQGFTAWEDNEAAARPVAEQVAMARAPAAGHADGCVRRGHAEMGRIPAAARRQ